MWSSEAVARMRSRLSPSVMSLSCATIKIVPVLAVARAWNSSRVPGLTA